MRRESLWFGIAAFRVSLAIGVGNVTGSLNAAALALRPFTVIRARGLVGIRTDQVAASEAQQAAYGAAVVSDQSVAIGLTAVPTPVTDSGSDLFFVYQRMMAEMTFGTAASFQTVLQTFEIDSRAMRKVESGQDLIEVVEVEAGAQSDGCILTGAVRFLIKLH